MRIRVTGGAPLNGTYTPAGSANAAIALLAAALLTDKAVTLRRMPDTASTQLMRELAALLGAEFNSPDNDPHTLTLRTPQIARRSFTSTETGGFVGALLLLAPILLRRGYVRMEIDFPLNRVRTHLDALRDLGQSLSITDGAIEVRAAAWDYRDIMLAESSVTATEIALMLAASLGKETFIRSAAGEPHVQTLAHALELMGAQIEGIGSNVLHVFGTDSLHGADCTLPADSIEAASIAALAAVTGGRVHLNHLHTPHLRSMTRVFARLGVRLDMDEDALYVPRHESLIASERAEDQDASIKAAPWPGFPSDLISMATLIATQTRGTTLIHEPMFDNRLLFVDKLNAMGAQIVLADPHRAIVVGPTPLYAIYMDSPDVRVGLGLLGAALVADGQSVIDNAQALHRGFDGVLHKLIALGAQIKLEA